MVTADRVRPEELPHCCGGEERRPPPHVGSDLRRVLKGSESAAISARVSYANRKANGHSFQLVSTKGK